MAWFLFVGDMFVMLFMVLLVMWVSTASSRATQEFSAGIPLADDLEPAVPAAGEGEAP
jgi:hypothetical protein